MSERGKTTTYNSRTAISTCADEREAAFVNSTILGLLDSLLFTRVIFILQAGVNCSLQSPKLRPMKYKLQTSVSPIPRHMVRLLLTSSFLPCFSWRRLSYRACWVSELTVYVSELIVLWNFSLTCNVQTVATQTHQNRLPNKDVRKVGMREGVITCTKKGSLSLRWRI